MNRIVYTLVFFSFFSISLFSQKSKFVDLFIGTAGDNGQVDPAACIPYGMVRICPDMNPRSHVGYDYDVNEISGFTVNRISGIGCGGAGGNLRLKPDGTDTKLSIIKSSEHAAPGFYGVALNNGVKIELTATNNIAVERFFYPKGKKAIMTFDLTAGFEKIRECKYTIQPNKNINGFIRTGNTCNHGEYKLYFNLTTSHNYNIISSADDKLEIEFLEVKEQPVEVRIALSPINEDGSIAINTASMTLDFNKIKNNAVSKWEDILSRIDIKNVSLEENILFYTSLYRIFLSPANVTSLDSEYLATDGSIQHADNFTYYSSWSMWDSYRTKFPMITLLDASTMRDICLSLNKLFIYGKKDWATSFESTPTVRTEHSIPVLLDAYRKGIKFDLGEAYDGFKKEITTLQTSRPDQAFETCIDLWSISQIADILGKAEDAQIYATQAKELFLRTWKKDFKNIDESFKKMKDSGLYQGTRWQYRWGVPQYLDTMATTSGGKDVLVQQLDYYFANNLSNQTNEPGLHIPYLYNRLGEYGKAQQIVRKILTEKMLHLYGGNAEYIQPVFDKTFKVAPKGFLPEMDEDDGTMSAYYIFGAIGLYPLIVGEPWYEITSPLYDETILKLDQNKKLTIKVKNRKTLDDPIQKITFNKKGIHDFRINHNDLIKGGLLLLEY
ncbi:MAG: glycoside hydrolase family 92 protein [Dysgonomonas sp.]